MTPQEQVVTLRSALSDALESLRRLPDIEGAWRATCISQAESALKATAQPDPATAPKVVYFACRTCGCTDVECGARIHANTGEDTGEDFGKEYNWCPQCEDNCGWFDEVETLKPYVRPEN